MAASKPTLWAKKNFTLAIFVDFGTLGSDLGCFPLDKKSYTLCLTSNSLFRSFNHFCRNPPQTNKRVLYKE